MTAVLSTTCSNGDDDSKNTEKSTKEVVQTTTISESICHKIELNPEEEDDDEDTLAEEPRKKVANESFDLLSKEHSLNID